MIERFDRIPRQRGLWRLTHSTPDQACLFARDPHNASHLFKIQASEQRNGNFRSILYSWNTDGVSFELKVQEKNERMILWGDDDPLAATPFTLSRLLAKNEEDPFVVHFKQTMHQSRRSEMSETRIVLHSAYLLDGRLGMLELTIPAEKNIVLPQSALRVYLGNIGSGNDYLMVNKDNDSFPVRVVLNDPKNQKYYGATIQLESHENKPYWQQITIIQGSRGIRINYPVWKDFALERLFHLGKATIQDITAGNVSLSKI